MKPRHVQAERTNARAVLSLCNISIGQDFYTLRPTQIECLILQADLVRYRKPRNANGSRARYFHDMLQRRSA